MMAGVLTACAVSSPHYYTLLPIAASGPAQSPDSGAVRHYAISVQPVVLPEQVDRPQIVITDPGSTQVTPLNSALWASPLSDEIRNALSNDLSRKLGVLDISDGAAPDSLAVWKVSLQVQRFESLYGQHAVLDATWRLTPVNQSGKKTRICRAQAQVPVEAGVSAMVAGHQEALRRLSSLIAAQLAGTAAPPAVAGLQEKGCTY
jgi:uncharacterized lipoprotein YmbA